MTEHVQARLKDRQEMLYHVVWSVIMDGPHAWEAVHDELRRQIPAGDLSIENKGWVIYPPHPSAVGTNSYDTRGSTKQTRQLVSFIADVPLASR
ncbi:MAG: hypothetical protein A2V70_14010 [Planctomycetes bacterium RBG_13_63_9]|nr:MAG: hypothetical protein A2V70_14010 [Planctomycetes bacterium RBG_13_63_9]